MNMLLLKVKNPDSARVAPNRNAIGCFQPHLNTLPLSSIVLGLLFRIGTIDA